jgi:hypothetical protein
MFDLAGIDFSPNSREKKRLSKEKEVKEAVPSLSKLEPLPFLFLRQSKLALKKVYCSIFLSGRFFSGIVSF